MGYTTQALEFLPTEQLYFCLVQFSLLATSQYAEIGAEYWCLSKEQNFSIYLDNFRQCAIPSNTDYCIYGLDVKFLHYFKCMILSASLNHLHLDTSWIKHRINYFTPYCFCPISGYKNQAKLCKYYSLWNIFLLIKYFRVRPSSDFLQN